MPNDAMTQQKNLTEAKEIAAKSGNSFHAKVLLALKGAGWEVLVSPYYNDQATGKPREVDLIAEKAFVATDTFDQPKGTIHIQLYIECKYLNQTTVLWTHLQDLEATLDMLEKKTPLRRTYTIVNDHHYLRQPDNLVVKLFAGQSGQSTEGEQLYKGLNQVLNSMISYSSKGSILKKQQIPHPNWLATAKYPIIICGGENRLFKTEIGSDSDPIPVDQNLLLEVNYSYSHSPGMQLSEYFLIDLVQFELLDEFLGAVGKDIKAIKMMVDD